MSIQNLPAIYDGHQLNIVLIGGERWLRSSQIGLALGYSFPQQSMNRIFKRNGSEFGVDDTMLVELPTDSGPQLTRLFSDKGITKIAMLASTAKAAAFRDWAATMLTTPSQPALPPALALPADALRILARHYGVEPLIRYARLGLTNIEITRLLGVGINAVRKRRRLAESLGLIAPPLNLSLMRDRARRLHDQTRKRGQING